MTSSRVKPPVPEGYQLVSFPGRPEKFVIRDDFAVKFRAAVDDDPKLLETLASRPGRGMAIQFQLPGGGACVLRHYEHGGMFAWAFQDIHFGWGRALHELQVYQWADRNGVPTPQVLGFCATSICGALMKLALITQRIENAVSLEACINHERWPETRGNLIPLVARVVRQMHEAHIYHADLHIKNLMVSFEGGSPAQVYVLDLDRARVTEEESPGLARGNLFRLNRSITKAGIPEERFTGKDRILFLHHYWKGQNMPRTQKREFIKRCERHLLRHRIWWQIQFR